MRAWEASPDDRSSTGSAPQHAELVQAAGRFLSSYWESASSDQEIEQDLARVIARNPDGVERGVQALRSIILDSACEDAWVGLVLWEANRPLDDPTPAGARRWLSQVVERTERLLEQGRRRRRDQPSG